MLESIGVRYALGGSLASSIVGEPRSTIDIDMAVEMTLSQLDQLIEHCGDDFYIPTESARLATASFSSFNLLHNKTALKVDLFVTGDSLLDRLQIQNRTRIALDTDPPIELWVTSTEDQILRKLSWFKQGGETSDRQWRDIVSILRVQASRIDTEKLDQIVAEIGLQRLLDQARQEADRAP